MDTIPPHRELRLSCGRVAKVDPEDYRILSAMNWHADPRGSRVYARSGRLYLHRVVLGLGPGNTSVVDHINNDGLDCRKANLRCASFSQNVQNRLVRSDNTTGFRGILYSKRTHLWYVRIRHDGEEQRRGGFKTAEAAARVYDDLARELHGPFARLNFPTKDEQGAKSF